MGDLKDSQLLIHFLEGSLAPSKQAELEARLEAEPALLEELEQLQELYAELEDPQTVPVPTKVEEGFYAFLGQVQSNAVTQEAKQVAVLEMGGSSSRTLGFDHSCFFYLPELESAGAIIDYAKRDRENAAPVDAVYARKPFRK